MLRKWFSIIDFIILVHGFTLFLSWKYLLKLYTFCFEHENHGKEEGSKQNTDNSDSKNKFIVLITLWFHIFPDNVTWLAPIKNIQFFAMKL